MCMLSNAKERERRSGRYVAESGGRHGIGSKPNRAGMACLGQWLGKARVALRRSGRSLRMGLDADYAESTAHAYGRNVRRG